MGYFERLTQVDDLGDSLQVDKYLEHTKQITNTISISFNQIFLVHRLLKLHLDAVVSTLHPQDRPPWFSCGRLLASPVAHIRPQAKPNDPIREIIQQCVKQGVSRKLH